MQLADLFAEGTVEDNDVEKTGEAEERRNNAWIQTTLFRKVPSKSHNDCITDSR